MMLEKHEGYTGNGYRSNGYHGEGYHGGGYHSEGYRGEGFRSACYATGYVTGLSRTLIGRTAMERIANASSVEEAVRLIAEAGWGDVPDRQATEAMADKTVLDACQIVRMLSPEARITDCFLLKYDILNLKTLIKSKSLGLRAERLSPCGTVPESVMRHAIESGDTQRLPEAMRETVSEIDEMNALHFDPLKTDSLLDRLHYRMIFDKLDGRGHPLEKHYFEASVDLVNLMMVLRSMAMEKGAQFAGELLIPGGSISREALVKAYGDADRLGELTAGKPYAAAFNAGLGAWIKGSDLAAVEKKIDDYLTSLLRPHRYDVNSILPLIGYLVAREREAAAVRLVLTAKAARLPQERLTERLRELYE